MEKQCHRSIDRSSKKEEKGRKKRAADWPTTCYFVAPPSFSVAYASACTDLRKPIGWGRRGGYPSDYRRVANFELIMTGDGSAIAVANKKINKRICLKLQKKIEEKWRKKKFRFYNKIIIKISSICKLI